MRGAAKREEVLPPRLRTPSCKLRSEMFCDPSGPVLGRIKISQSQQIYKTWPVQLLEQLSVFYSNTFVLEASFIHAGYSTKPCS